MNEETLGLIVWGAFGFILYTTYLGFMYVWSFSGVVAVLITLLATPLLPLVGVYTFF